MEIQTGAEQADYANDDQIERDDVVQQSRHHQNKDAGDQRNQRHQGEMDVHVE